MAEEREIMERHLAEERAYSEELRKLHGVFQRRRNLVAKEFTKQDTTMGESSKMPLESIGLQKILSGVPVEDGSEESHDDDEGEVDS